MNVLQAVKEIDRSGREFYREMADRTGHTGVRTIFLRLAEDEKEKIDHLTRLAETLPHIALRESRAIDVSTNVFEKLRTREGELVGEVTDDVAAYDLARHAEEEVVGLLREAISQENRPEVRSLLRRILNAELHELEELEHLYDFANAPNQHLAWGEFSNLEEFHNFGRDVG